MIKKFTTGLLCMSLLFSVFSCASGADDAPESAEETTDSSKMDHEIKTDYLEATPTGEHEVRILFINVGKADSILLEIDEKYYMIDAGTTDSVPAVLTGMAYMGCDALSGAFITHAHNDHVGGADEICSAFPVERYYTAAISTDMQKLSSCAVRYGIPYAQLEAGSVVELSEGVYLETFGPYRYNPNENNNSLVLKLRVNGVSVLLTGDMLFDEEKTLLKQDFDLSCDVLKAAHHGRKDATSVSFLEAASPSTVIISTNTAEQSDSPHESILAAFAEIGADVYVTQDYDVGILVSIAADGAYTVENATIENRTEAELSFVSVSKEDQSATICNTGDSDLDVSRFFIFSDRGSEIFIFPENSVIRAGEEVVIASADNAEADYIWEETKIWSKSKQDTAILYDKYGNVLDKMDSE